MPTETEINADHENTQLAPGPSPPENVAACEELVAPCTNSDRLRYDQSENIADKFPREPKGLEGQRLPAPKTARDPIADVKVNKSSDECKGNTVNTIASEVDLVVRALAIIGSPKQLADWMKTSIPALQGQTPYSLMNSEGGRKRVEAVLGRIEHGIY